MLLKSDLVTNCFNIISQSIFFIINIHSPIHTIEFSKLIMNITKYKPILFLTLCWKFIKIHTFHWKVYDKKKHRFLWSKFIIFLIDRLKRWRKSHVIVVVLLTLDNWLMKEYIRLSSTIWLTHKMELHRCF